jgi:hypothetical protein
MSHILKSNGNVVGKYVETAISKRIAAFPEEERFHRRLVETLRHCNPVTHRLSTAERNRVWRILRESPSLLRQRREGIEGFFGDISVLPDGLPVITIRRHPPRHATAPEFLCWGSPFGACLRVMMHLESASTQVALHPRTPAFDALRNCRVIIGYLRLGKLEEAIQFDYSTQRESGKALTDLLDLVIETHEEILKHPTGLDEPEMVKLHSVGKLFEHLYGRLEWLQTGWLREYEARRPFVVELLSAYCSDAEQALKLTPLSAVPIVSDIARLLAASNPLAERVNSIKEILREGSKASECLERASAIFHRNDAELPELQRTLQAIVEICSWMELDIRVSDAGRRQAYHDSMIHEVVSWSVKPELFPIANDEAAAAYW